MAPLQFPEVCKSLQGPGTLGGKIAYAVIDSVPQAGCGAGGDFEREPTDLSRRRAMSVARSIDVFQRMVASLSILAMLTSGLAGQTGAALPESPQQNSQQNPQPSPQQNPQTSAAVNAPGQPEYTAPLEPYTQPASMLGVWKPYTPHGLPQPVLKNSDRLHSLIRENKLMLSLNDAVALALESYFDIATARYNLDIANTDLL